MKGGVNQQVSGATVPAASVILLTFNRPKLLRWAIESVLKQTYPNFEIIIADDAGSYPARLTAEYFSDGRIRVIRQAENVGVVRNLRTALQLVRGRYVAVMNDDDLWLSDYLAKLVTALDTQPEASIAFGDHHFIGVDGEILSAMERWADRVYKRPQVKPGLHRPFHRLALIQHAIPMVMATMFRKDGVEISELDERAGFAYDLWLTYILCRRGAGAVYVPGKLSCYRVHSGNAGLTSKLQHALDTEYCYRSMLEDPLLADIRTDLRRAHTEALMAVAHALSQAGRRGDAFRAFKRALRGRPRARSVARTALGFIGSGQFRASAQANSQWRPDKD